MRERGPRYRALLIGAANYGAPGVSALPFVHDDLERMSAALQARGFHQVTVAQVPVVTPNEVNGEVMRFLGEAEQGDRLLIVLSGHGIHSRGKDYLVPEDIRSELLTFAKGCVEIDWREEVEESRAAQVVFLIDACREGIDQDTKATSAWSSRKATAAKGRRVAYVYACSQAEFARYVRETDEVRAGHDVGTEPGESFSLFSRAATELLGGSRLSGGGLRAFRTAVQEHVDALHAAYGKPGRAQRVRVLSETPEEEFVILPPSGPEGTGPGGVGTVERAWGAAVAAHPAWKLTEAAGLESAVEQLQEAGAAIVARYARRCGELAHTLAQDPWYDAELAQRTTDRLGFLLRRLAPGTVLSPTEAALLVVLPFAAQAHWAKLTAERTVPDAELDAFLRTFPRLTRRLGNLQSGDPSRGEALSQIRWWAFHRWLVRHPETFSVKSPAPDVPSDSAWIRDELSEPRLLRHIQEQRIAPVSAPGTTRPTELADERTVAPSAADEHPVRERLVSALLKAAHALAIDPADLPEVLVEHLGISDSVRLDALLGTVRQSQWLASGTGRALRAQCQHPAVEVALKEHTQDVDALLRELNRLAASDGSLSPLRPLPAYAHAQEVGLTAASPAGLAAGIRFRLDAEQIQELLMGEQLYGDRSLAVRELYQNALDACRYREARTEYLTRTGRPVPAWQGAISFVGGTDADGRAYLDCVDNGIGMGITELTEAFARAGSRFVNLPEYIEEGRLWKSLDPPVTLEPVSRFGIGVLSYFMVADEITVWTCRLNRDGHPGRLLKVTIAGPGNLFRVEDLGPGEEAGTTVRLHAAEDRQLPLALKVLGRRLRVARYRVAVRDGGRDTRIWEPGVLYDADRRDGTLTQPRMSLVQSSPAHEVWWIDGRGEVLVDGLSTGDTTPGSHLPWSMAGRIANLHGGHARLSVDRKSLIDYDADVVHDHCRAAVDDLMEQPDLLTPDWLLDLHIDDSRLATAVLDRAAQQHHLWRTEHGTFDAGLTGLVPVDPLLAPAVTGLFSAPGTNEHSVASLLVRCMPEPLVRWRLRVLLGLPTDGLSPVGTPDSLALFSNAGFSVALWRSETRDVAERYSYARTEYDPDDEFAGYPGPSDRYEGLVGELNGLLNLPQWRSDADPLTATEVLDKALHTGVSVRETVARLRGIGYATAPLGPVEEATTEDFIFLTYRYRYRGRRDRRWLRPGAHVPLAHLLSFDDPARAAARLAELGYSLPDAVEDRIKDCSATDAHRTEIARALMEHRDALPTTRERAMRVTVDQILTTAGKLRLHSLTLTERLRRLGFTVSDSVPSEEPHDAYGDFGTPTPAATELAAAATPIALRTAAELADVPETQVRAALREEGVEPPDATDPAYDRILIGYLDGSADHTQDFVPPGLPIRLAELASAALATRKTFREVAEFAGKLGFTHEAQDWFTDEDPDQGQ